MKAAPFAVHNKVYFTSGKSIAPRMGPRAVRVLSGMAAGAFDGRAISIVSVLGSGALSVSTEVLIERRITVEHVFMGSCACARLIPRPMHQRKASLETVRKRTSMMHRSERIKIRRRLL